MDDLQNSEPETTTPAPAVEAQAPAPVAPAAPAPRAQVRIDDTKAVSGYANFCRVTGSPEELILDFGLNPQPFGPPAESLAIGQRIIVNYYTAKRMAQALVMTIQRHEAAFGAIETDVQRRVARRAPGGEA